MKPKIYVETTIPSFFYEVRLELGMAARREWTRTWWRKARKTLSLVTSTAVLDELESGDYASRKQCLALVSSLPLLAPDSAVNEIVKAYIKNYLMPNDTLGDAMHLALASYNRCDFLVTWNCTHLANANKFGHIRRVNSMLGISIPALVTPLELLGGDL